MAPENPLTPLYDTLDLDRAATGREIGTLVALKLLAAGADGLAALELLDDIEGFGIVPETDHEIDAVPLAREAIKAAMRMRGTVLE